MRISILFSVFCFLLTGCVGGSAVERSYGGGGDGTNPARTLYADIAVVDLDGDKVSKDKHELYDYNSGVAATFDETANAYYFKALTVNSSTDQASLVFDGSIVELPKTPQNAVAVQAIIAISENNIDPTLLIAKFISDSKSHEDELKDPVSKSDELKQNKGSENEKSDGDQISSSPEETKEKNPKAPSQENSPKDQNSPNSPSDSSSHDNPVDVSEGPSVNQLPNPNDYKSASQELSEIYPMNSEGDNMPSIVVWDISENDPQSEPGREAETSTDPQIKGETNTSVIDSPNKGSGKL